MAVATGPPGATGDLQRVPHLEPLRPVRRRLSRTSSAHAGADSEDGDGVAVVGFGTHNTSSPARSCKGPFKINATWRKCGARTQHDCLALSSYVIHSLYKKSSRG